MVGYAGSYQGNTADIQQGHNVPYSIGVECGQQGSAYPPSYIQLVRSKLTSYYSFSHSHSVCSQISPPQRSAQSAPGSPSSASPTVSMQQQVSYPPGFSSIAAQMQNISIDHRNIQQQQQNMVVSLATETSHVRERDVGYYAVTEFINIAYLWVAVTLRCHFSCRETLGKSAMFSRITTQDRRLGGMGTSNKA